MPALLAVVLGLGLGRFCGGHIGALSYLRLRGELLILPLFVLQAFLRGRALGSWGTLGGAMAVWVAVSLTLVVCLFFNLRVRGTFVLVMGLVMNLAVVLANNGMPVSTSSSEPVSLLETGFYAVAGPWTLGGLAGDVMPVELGWATLMMSAGDVLLMVGVCTTIIGAMLATDTPRSCH